MTLPVYLNVNFKSSAIEEITGLLHTEMNLRHPVVFNVKALDIDQQREVIGLVENFFVSNNISYSFPYPVYILTDHEASITKVPVFSNPSELPKFFSSRDNKMNVKEAHLSNKNKLLQQDILNSDAFSNQSNIDNYGHTHRQIKEMQLELDFCRFIYNRLTKAKR